MSSFGLIIGRFQPLHKGHLLLIEKSLQENIHTLILIGSSNKSDAYNPFNFKWRKNVLESEIKGENFSIGALPDFPSDKEWLQCIIQYIPKETKHVTLYCGDIKKDSAVKSIKKLKDILPCKLSFTEVSRGIIPISASQVREWIQEKNISQLKKYLGSKTLEKILQI